MDRFEMFELEAYLGDFSNEFDVEGIIEEATVVDSDGNRYWKDGVDLAEICERHER